MIEINNLVKKYKNKTVLEGLKLNIYSEHKTYAIIGESGTGKTTLLNILSGIDKNYKGIYKLFGEDVQTFSSKKWDELRSNEIKIVFQDYKLLNNLTSFENIYYSGNYLEEDINKVLKDLGILEYSNQKARNLSGGQQQRLALARAVIANPKVIFLDEPTGNLDGLTTNNVIKLFEKLRERDVLLIMITHDIRLIEYADVIYELKDKRLKLFAKEDIDG